MFPAASSAIELPAMPVAEKTTFEVCRRSDVLGFFSQQANLHADFRSVMIWRSWAALPYG
jgi:hypothetical protein